MPLEPLVTGTGSSPKAVMPVHLYGQACDVARLRTITHLPIVEDAAQALSLIHI